ncbi:UDP-glycosyltransferase 87A2-like [Oryza brachyantha]|uniref:UDP-glycosyltransferase 87A2-like n=1 Tax=Oryza brachyantha TaxID=4533 RepID=UPI001AD965E6|nr:UDP-glycosyltransferase 87A2-like [Oryza brachyantha]
MGSAAAPLCHVVAVPYPGRGHVNAMLNLCRLLAARDGVTATVVVTEEWLGLLGGAAEEEWGAGVRLEAIPNVVPSEHGRAGDMLGFVEAVYTRMEAPFERLLDRLGATAAAPSAIVADTFVLPWAVGVGNRRGVPVCVLSALGATMFSVHYHFHRLPAAADGADPCLIGSYIPGLKSIRLSDLKPTHSNKNMLERIMEAYSCVRKAQCVIFTSFYELESNAVDALRQELPYPVFSVGPCIPYISLEAEHHHAGAEEEAAYMAWLDSQPAGSVLYVSLGSFLSVSPAQLDAIATGLAESKVRFLWVLRGSDAARSGVRDLLREGDAATAGMVVPWSDQLKVLCHPSVGGFLTHCGMNSTLEAVHAGVPMLTLPIAFDQPVVSRLISDEWKVGYGLREKAGDVVVGQEEIAAAVRRLMGSDAAEEAKETRRRASLMREASRAAAQVGGSSYRGITSLIDYLSEFKN